MAEPEAVAIRVQPRARQHGLMGERDGVIVVRIAAPPVDGAANAALTRFLAERLGVPRRDVALIRGRSSRTKWITVAGLPAQEVRRRLLAG